MIDLDIAFQKLHQLQLEDGDLGAAYWLEVSRLLKKIGSVDFLTLQGMADCMDMVRQELIEAEVIAPDIAPMFIANAVVHRLNVERKNAEHWKANHADQVARARVLIEREDLPLERIQAYKDYERLQAELTKASRILELTAIALGTPLAALQGFDLAKVVGMTQKAQIEALRFAECRLVASTMEEGEQAFVDEVDRHRRERSKTE